MDVKDAGFLSHVEGVSRTKVRGVLAILKQAEIIQKCGVVGEAVQLYLDEKITNFGMLRERHDKFLKDYMLENFMNVPDEYKAELMWQIDEKKRQDRLLIVGALVEQLQVIANQKCQARFPHMTAEEDSQSFSEDERRSSTTDTGNESDPESMKDLVKGDVMKKTVSWAEEKTMFDFNSSNLLTSYDPVVPHGGDIFAFQPKQEGNSPQGSRFDGIFLSNHNTTSSIPINSSRYGSEELHPYYQGDDFVMDELLQSIIDE